MVRQLKLELFTDSRAKTFRRCQREHRLRYWERIIATATADALQIGTVIHYGLEAWYRHPVHTRMMASLEAAREAARQSKLDAYDLAHAEALLEGYDEMYADELGHRYEVLDVEAEFRTPLVNPDTGATSKTFQLAGKLYVIVYDRLEGRKKFIEHKSSGESIEQGSPYWARRRLDSQVSVYFAGAASLGHDCTACIYDVLGKTGLRPLKATPMESRKYKADGALYANQRTEDETPEAYKERIMEDMAKRPERYYQRREIVRLDDEMRQFAREIWVQAQTMRDARRLQIAPANPDACERFGKLCSFFPYCSGEASLDDVSRFRRIDWPHPELTEEV